MAGISNNKTDVVLLRKRHPSSQFFRLCRIDGVQRSLSQGTVSRLLSRAEIHGRAIVICWIDVSDR